MLTRAAGWVDVPTWEPGPCETLLEIKAMLPLGPSQEGMYTRQPRDIRRVISYILTDGLGETLRKVRSRRLEEAIRGSRELVLAAGQRQEDKRSCLAIGTRHPMWIPRAPFHDQLTFPFMCGADFDRALSTFFLLARVHNHDFGALRNWLAPLIGYDPACGESPKLPEGLSMAALGRLEKGANNLAVPPGTFIFKEVAPISAKRRRVPAYHAQGFVLVGAGNYARTQAAHQLSKGGLRPRWVVDRDPVTAAMVGARLGVQRVSTTITEPLGDEGAPLFVVASFHDTHAPIACAALEAGKRVFVEKPPALGRSQLEQLYISCVNAPGRWRVGYNRRYAPMVRLAREALGAESGPVTVTCIIREATIPRSHWYYWTNQGTRISGNLCHWVDLAFLLCDRGCPASLSLSAPDVEGRRDEETVLVVTFTDGSQASIVGTGRGYGTLGVEETIVARRGSTTFCIQDFRVASFRRAGRMIKNWRGKRDRGHRDMFRSCARWAVGMPSQAPMSYELADLWIPNLLTALASEMAISGDQYRSISIGDISSPRMS